MEKRGGWGDRKESLANGTELRVPPHSLDAERSVLGGVLLDNKVIHTLAEMLEVDDFYSEGNARIYEAMRELFSSGTPVDSITLREKLVKADKLNACGGDEYLLSLTDVIPTTQNIEHHARIVKDKALVRRMISACHEVAQMGYGDHGECQEFLDGAEKRVFDVANVTAKKTTEHIKDVLMGTFKQIQALSEAGERIAGLPTGFTRLDEMTAGMHPGDLIIVAGRPGMGKTAFALNVGVNACVARGIGVAIFSLEMPRDQLARRMLCSEARVNAGRMRTGQLARDDWQPLVGAAGTLSELPLYLDDTPGLTLMELRAKTRRLHAQHGLGLVIVDYLQLMRSGTKNDSREQEISEISRSLKAFAKELECPIIALSQLNRGVESRGNKDKRPQLSDLRESGAIEQDADTIMFVYRDEVYNKEESDARGIAEIIVGKQRAGPVGTVRCKFFGEYTRFDNLDDREASAYDD